jgi:dolichol kinase
MINFILNVGLMPPYASSGILALAIGSVLIIISIVLFIVKKRKISLIVMLFGMISLLIGNSLCSINGKPYGNSNQASSPFLLNKKTL